MTTTDNTSNTSRRSAVVVALHARDGSLISGGWPIVGIAHSASGAVAAARAAGYRVLQGPGYEAVALGPCQVPVRGVDGDMVYEEQWIVCGEPRKDGVA